MVGTSPLSREIGCVKQRVRSRGGGAGGGGDDELSSFQLRVALREARFEKPLIRPAAIFAAEGGRIRWLS
ncbi:MAG: hypothetical protein ACKOJF_21545, partial [Planctomycetaceae bacterium]